MSEKKLIWGLEPSKYPARAGKPWKDDEVMKLLKFIKENISIQEIANQHERTIGGINSQIKKMAVNYHFNNNLSMENIQKFTGLKKWQITEAIKEYEYKENAKKAAKDAKKAAKDAKKAAKDAKKDYEPVDDEINLNDVLCIKILIFKKVAKNLKN